MSPAVMKCDDLHNLCAVSVPVPGSCSCIVVSLYRFLVLACSEAVFNHVKSNDKNMFL